MEPETPPLAAYVTMSILTGVTLILVTQFIARPLWWWAFGH